MQKRGKISKSIEYGNNNKNNCSHECGMDDVQHNFKIKFMASTVFVWGSRFGYYNFSLVNCAD